MKIKSIKKCRSYLTQQIAFGVDAQCKSNPDTHEIMKYCRDNGVMPNVTVADIDNDTADKLVGMCGAVAVSRYEDKDICYNTIKRLSDRGMENVNMHLMISEETYDMALETLRDIKHDERLKGLNAIVFLSLKKKGRGEGFHRLDDISFKHLVDSCFGNDIRFGFDSCSFHHFITSIKDRVNYDELVMVAEPCESSLFSAYIDVSGCFHPCSFCEGIDIFPNGIDVIGCNDFIDDIWKHTNVSKFRNILIDGGRNCPAYIV